MPHSFLSPSSSNRWINCSGSLLLPQFDDSDKTAANEGSLAHKLSELKLMRDEWYDYKSELKAVRENELYHPSMEHYTDNYIAFIYDQSFTEMLIEEVVDLSFIYPDFFGTADCILFNDSDKPKLHVIDFKYGRGYVKAENNTQMMIYALGAVQKFHERLRDFKNFDIDLTIYQPRINNIATWHTDWKDLVKWHAETLIPAISKIYYNVIEENTGDYCRYCRANIFCGNYNNQFYLDEETDVKALSDSEIEENLEKLEEVEKLLKRNKSYVIKEIKSGKTFKNHKLVAGRKTRCWNDQEALKKTLIGNNHFDRVAQLPSPAQLEKKLSKEEMADYISFIGTKEGKPILVKKEDRREELSFEN